MPLVFFYVLQSQIKEVRCDWEPGVLSIMSGSYGGAPSKRLQMYKRVEMSLAEIYERVGKSVISVCKKAQKG